VPAIEAMGLTVATLRIANLADVVPVPPTRRSKVLLLGFSVPLVVIKGPVGTDIGRFVGNRISSGGRIPINVIEMLNLRQCPKHYR